MVHSVKRGREIKEYQSRNVTFVRLERGIMEEATESNLSKMIRTISRLRRISKLIRIFFYPLPVAPVGLMKALDGQPPPVSSAG